MSLRPRSWQPQPPYLLHDHDLCRADEGEGGSGRALRVGRALGVCLCEPGVSVCYGTRTREWVHERDRHVSVRRSDDEDGEKGRGSEEDEESNQDEHKAKATKATHSWRVEDGEGYEEGHKAIMIRWQSMIAKKWRKMPTNRGKSQATHESMPTHRARKRLLAGCS